MLAIYCNWKQSHKKTSELPKKMERNTSLMSIAALENQYHHKDNIQDIEQTNTERPIIFSLLDVDHFYLVYEYVRYGSLNDHLHDPLLKGHQPLSWNARAQIALDAARGIEYIHDHMKAHYVHRTLLSMQFSSSTSSGRLGDSVITAEYSFQYLDTSISGGKILF